MIPFGKDGGSQNNCTLYGFNMRTIRFRTGPGRSCRVSKTTGSIVRSFGKQLLSFALPQIT